MSDLLKSFPKSVSEDEKSHVGLWRGWVAEKLTTRNVTNDIKVDLSTSTVWFKDKSDESWWACNISIESQQNEKNSKAVYVWDCAVEDDLNELIDTTYTNKMHLLFSSISYKNSTIKRVWIGIVMT